VIIRQCLYFIIGSCTVIVIIRRYGWLYICSAQYRVWSSVFSLFKTAPCPLVWEWMGHSLKFALIWFSGFWVNVIFYQNMPNLHNRYKSRVGKKAGRNTHISQDGWKYWEIRLILNLQIWWYRKLLNWYLCFACMAYFDKRSHLLRNRWTKLKQIWVNGPSIPKPVGKGPT
jgi:hypothetical protein